jgi:hypothetical protein
MRNPFRDGSIAVSLLGVYDDYFFPSVSCRNIAISLFDRDERRPLLGER